MCPPRNFRIKWTTQPSVSPERRRVQSLFSTLLGFEAIRRIWSTGVPSRSSIFLFRSSTVSSKHTATDRLSPVRVFTKIVAADFPGRVGSMLGHPAVLRSGGWLSPSPPALDSGLCSAPQRGRRDPRAPSAFSPVLLPGPVTSSENETARWPAARDWVCPGLQNKTPEAAGFPLPWRGPLSVPPSQVNPSSPASAPQRLPASLRSPPALPSPRLACSHGEAISFPSSPKKDSSPAPLGLPFPASFPCVGGRLHPPALVILGGVSFVQSADFWPVSSLV